MNDVKVRNELLRQGRKLGEIDAANEEIEGLKEAVYDTADVDLAGQTEWNAHYVNDSGVVGSTANNSGYLIAAEKGYTYTAVIPEKDSGSFGIACFKTAAYAGNGGKTISFDKTTTGTVVSVTAEEETGVVGVYCRTGLLERLVVTKSIASVDKAFRELKGDIATRLEQPKTGIEVGKYFRVAATDEQGNPVLEAVSLADIVGAGMYVNNNKLYVSAATENGIDKRSGGSYIDPMRLDYAVRAGLLSNSKITDADKPLICETIGAERKKGDWELKGTIIGDETNRGNIDTGALVNLAGCTELLIKCSGSATESSSLSTKNGVLIYDAFTASKKSFNGLWVDYPGVGLQCVSCKYTGSEIAPSNQSGMANTSLGYSYVNEFVTVAKIDQIYFVKPSAITRCNLEIYAR